MNKDIERKIATARVALLYNHPFYGYLAISLALKEGRTQTMGTDGRSLIYNPDFVDKLSPEELKGVICHEIVHVILNHIPRRKNRLQKRWNWAADYADNLLVTKDGLTLPKGALLDYKYDEKSVEWIYTYMDNPPEEDGESGDGSGGKGDTDGQGGSGQFDDHEPWDNWGKGDGKGDGEDGEGDGEGGGSGAGMTVDDLTRASAELEKQWQERVAQAAQQAKMRGKFPGHFEELVGEILQPKLDWKAILRDMLTSVAKNDYRWYPANKKHIFRGFYLPSASGESINVGAIIDTSGSMDLHLIAEGLAEVKGICESYDDYLLYLVMADADVQKTWELTPMDELPTLVYGRGGTDFRPAIEWFKDKEVSAVVFFTDMYGTFPEKAPDDFEVIWVATSDVNPPWGRLIRFPE